MLCLIFFAAMLCVCFWATPSRATEQLAPRGPVPARPAVAIPMAKSAPEADGALDDPAWESAVTLRQFNLSYQGGFAPYETEAKLMYDDANLYIGLRCLDAELTKYPSLPDDAHVAEVVLATGIEETYYKVAVNSEGKVYLTQPMGNTVEWTVPPTAVMKPCAEGWQAEFAIPLAGADLPAPKPLAAWRINMGWRLPNRTNYSAWAVTHAWFYEPQFFGDVYFAGPKALTAELSEIGRPKPDANPLPLVLTNRAASEAPCEVLVTLEDEHGLRVAYQSFVTVPPSQTIQPVANYDLPDGTHGVAVVAVRRTGDSAPFFRHSIPIDMTANRQAYRAIQAALAALPESSDARRLRDENKAVQNDLNELGAKLTQPNLSREAWDALARPTECLLGRAQKLLWRWDHREQIGDAPFAVGTEISLRKTIGDRAYLGPLADTISLSAARGEYEGAQLLVVPLGTDLENIRVDVSPLEGPDGALVPAENIEVRWAGFVESRKPRYPIEYIGRFADPLMPMDAAPGSVAADALHQPLWLSVHVPHNIPAGVYTGRLEVSAEGLRSWPVQLRVRVYGFDLPTRPALQTSMWLNPSHITDWYGWEKTPKDIERRQMAFLLDHRINPSWFGPMGDEDDIDFQIERGLNLVMLGVIADWPLDPEEEERIQRHYDFFKERGLLDICFIYGQDEPSKEDYPRVREVLGKVAERFPGVRRVCTAYPPVPTLEGAVDTWVVGPNLFNYGPVAERVAAGDELWIYLSASVRRPYVTQFYLDYTALENRLIGFYCWKYGATGFLYWGINEWRGNNQPWSGDPEIDDAIRAGKRWPEVPWNTWTYLNCNGDAQYIYPGPDGEFWSSARLEMIRDAFEDYDYLALLDEARKRLAEAALPNTDALLADAEALLAIDPPLASDLTEATNDPTVLLKHREAVAEHLERILRALAES